MASTKSILKKGTKPKTTTRSQTHHPVFGNCDILPQTQLPTELNVINYYRLLQSQQPDSSNSSLFGIIETELGKIWDDATIPTIATVKKKLSKFLDYHNSPFANVRKEKSRWENDPDEIKKRHDNFNKLFNISSCSCYNKLSTSDVNVPIP